MARQLKLNIYKGKRGGRRPGAGRKRIHSPGVSHREREVVTGRTPLHINFKYRVEVKNKTCLQILKRAILNARRHGLAVIHFSLQHNHVHLIVEASNNEILTRGMRSLLVTFAKRLKKGKVQFERYHLHVLRNLRETKNAIHYVLFNEQRHKRGVSRIDAFSSLLSLPRAMELIRAYVTRSNSEVVIERGQVVILEAGESWLLKKALRSCDLGAPG